jgi:DNA-binding HxlR family transcriptional regulator
VEYSLTSLGASLAPVIDALRTWGEAFKAQLAA